MRWTNARPDEKTNTIYIIKSENIDKETGSGRCPGTRAYAKILCRNFTFNKKFKKKKL